MAAGRAGIVYNSELLSPAEGSCQTCTNPQRLNSEIPSTNAVTNIGPIKNSVLIWLRTFADANMTGLSWMPRTRCCWNAQPNNRKKSYVCVWSTTGERANYAGRLQLSGLEGGMRFFAQYQVSIDQTILFVEVSFAPWIRLMTGAGHQIMVVPPLRRVVASLRVQCFSSPGVA